MTVCSLVSPRLGRPLARFFEVVGSRNWTTPNQTKRSKFTYSQSTSPLTKTRLIATMMMERAKTAPASDGSGSTDAKQPTPSSATAVRISTAPKDASAEDRVTDLERRLNQLGGGESIASTSGATAPSMGVSTANASQAAPANSTTAVSAASSSATQKSNPLLVSCICKSTALH